MRNPDTDTLMDTVVSERIAEKKKRLDSARPLSVAVLKRLAEDLRLRHTYHSNAIEGNTLTLQETRLVLEGGMTVSGKPIKDHLEAVNGAEAFDLMKKLAEGRKPIDHIVVQRLHETLTRGLLEGAGKYRTLNVRIAGARKSPPDFAKIPKLMEDLFTSLSRPKAGTVETAATLHHGFVMIHPFVDGNGRVARLLANLYLVRQGYPPVVLRTEDRARYYECLRRADREDLKPFANFVARAVDESLTYHLAAFGGKDELLPLNVLAKETPYSQEYLSLRARQGKLDAVKLGRVWHASKRAVANYVKKHT
jgi:Fic family protein